jgi:pimeloyl-ACP methyl ester carboxylesterase
MRQNFSASSIWWWLGASFICAAVDAVPTRAQAKIQEEGTRVELETADGVYLTGRYWSPRGANRDTPVVLLLHPRGGSQREWYAFARALQEGKLPQKDAEKAASKSAEPDGFAVMTFDFRGHGESKAVDREVYRSPKEVSEKDRRRSAARTRRQTDSTDSARRRSQGEVIDEAEEFRAGRDLIFLANDIEAVKDHLIKENNAGRLNLRRFGIVAVGPATSAVALTWLSEFEFQATGAGFVRQGRDVAGVSLLSPGWGYQGLRPVTTLGRETDEVPMAVISGATSKSAADAGRVARAFRLNKLEIDPTVGAAPPAAEKQEPAEKPKEKAKPKEGERKEKKEKSSEEKKRSTKGRSDFYRPSSRWVELKTASEGMALLKEGGADFLFEFLRKSLKDPRGLAWEKREIDAGRGGFGTARD